MIQLKYDPSKMARLKQLINSESKGETFEEITLQDLVIGQHVIEQLPKIMEDISSIKVAAVLIVTDETPIKRGALILKDAPS